MRIAMDGLHLFGQYSGIQFAQARLLAEMQTSFPSEEIVLYAPRDFNGPPSFPSGPKTSPPTFPLLRRTWFPGRWRVIRTIWRNFRLQNKAYDDKCDVLHGPVYALPALLSMPSVVTLHDIIALTYPAFCTPGSARVQKRSIPRSIKVARRIIVPTQAVMNEVVRNLKVESDQIDVIPWGVGPEFKPIKDKERLKAARKHWNLPKQFILFVGTLEPKKNIETLIRGFFAAKMHGKLPHSLVLVGQPGWGMKRIESQIRNHNALEYVLQTGYVSDEALPLLYNLADLLVMPSHIEGFGMPVLEAMACGCPVIISDDPALEEVAGGAAHVAKLKVEQPIQVLREAIEHYLKDRRGDRDKLIKKGLKRAEFFTWKKTAEATLDSYRKALS